MALNHVTLDDKYDLTKSRIFVTGFQAIVRLCLMQKERDRRAGLNTAGYVTGYGGSLGTLDLQFIRAQHALDKYDVRFRPGSRTSPPPRSGARSRPSCAARRVRWRVRALVQQGTRRRPPGDVFRHANSPAPRSMAASWRDGRRPHRRILHHHQSEYRFIDVAVGLNPAGVRFSTTVSTAGRCRFCGSWVALKSMHETVESTAVIDGSLGASTSSCRKISPCPRGLNIRLRAHGSGREARLHD
jgi:indolepyruvate ferredoxin oxidoreductase